MKTRVALILIGILVVTVSLAAYYRSGNGADVPRFATTRVVRGAVVDTVEATGTLQAVTTVQVGSQVSGTIASLHADFNSRVKKGQVIARLDPSVLEAQVEQARASLVRLQAEVERARVTVDDAEQKLRRAKELYENQLIPAADYETAEITLRQARASLAAAEAQVTQARASLNQARVNLSHTIITAPVDGTVISRNVDVGQTVAASMSAPTLFEIAKDLTEMQVSASIDEADIGRIHAGQRVRFTVDAYPNEVFEGTVAQVRLQPVVTQNVVSYTTIIDVANPDLKLKPGMTATVEVEVAKSEDALLVPSAALRFRPGEELLAQAGEASGDRAATRVWTLQDGKPTPIRVRTGVSDGLTTAVESDELKEGMEVITGTAVTESASQPTTGTSSPFLPRRPAARTGGAR